MNRIKIMIALSLIVMLSLGFNAISSRSSIFNDIDAYCCDNGLCENTDPGINCRCSSHSTMMLVPTCEELNGTCTNCVDYTISGCVCYGGGSDFCMKDDETYYYGTPRNCDSSK